MRGEQVLRTIQTFDPQVVAVRLVPQRSRRPSDGRVLPLPAGARLLVRGLEPIVLLSDGRDQGKAGDDGGR